MKRIYTIALYDGNDNELSYPFYSRQKAEFYSYRGVKNKTRIEFGMYQGTQPVKVVSFTVFDSDGKRAQSGGFNCPLFLTTGISPVFGIGDLSWPGKRKLK